MKKQINPTIKAQILRSLFILLALVAICAIPFALAQRNQHSVAKPAAHPKAATETAGVSQAAQHKVHTAPAQRMLPYDVRSAPTLPRISQFPQNTSGAGAAHVLPVLRPPKAPQV